MMSLTGKGRPSEPDEPICYGDPQGVSFLLASRVHREDRLKSRQSNTLVALAIIATAMIAGFAGAVFLLSGFVAASMQPDASRGTDRVDYLLWPQVCLSGSVLVVSATICWSLIAAESGGPMRALVPRKALGAGLIILVLGGGLFWGHRYCESMIPPY